MTTIKKKSILVLTGLFISLFSILFTHNAFAGFTVTPLEFNISIEPGESQTNTFWIKNSGNEPFLLKIYLNDFWLDREGQEAFLAPELREYSCADWTALSHIELEIAAGESKPVRFTVDFPTDKSGSFWGIIFVEQVSNPKVDKRGDTTKQSFSVLTFQRVGVRVFINSTLGTKEGLIEDIAFSKDPLGISVYFKNTGTYVFKGEGKINILDDKANTIQTLAINKFRSYPNAARKIFTKLDEENKLPTGKYTAVAIIDYGSENLVAGELEFEI